MSVNPGQNPPQSSAPVTTQPAGGATAATLPTPTYQHCVAAVDALFGPLPTHGVAAAPTPGAGGGQQALNPKVKDFLAKALQGVLPVLLPLLLSLFQQPTPGPTPTPTPNP